MNDLAPLMLSIQLATITTVILAITALPLAWWLATTQSPLRPLVEAFTALPLILPPTVIGFYLLLMLNPTAPIGALWVNLTGDALTFSFSGLVVASVVYSLPFMVQPAQNTFARIGQKQRETAATLGAPPAKCFLHVVLPQAAGGLVRAATLSFAHTIGEFGVVLMIGGTIPGKTRVISVAIFEHVETLAYQQAHLWSALLVAGAFTLLVAVYANKTP